MAELKAGFYNAVMVEGLPDRTYNADEMNDFLEGLVSNSGIFATVSTACQVVGGSGLQVVVKAGKGMVDNHWFRIESDVTLNIDTADVILNRIDSVIVKNSNTDRKITLEIKKGTLATNPVAPTLTRNEEEYEICLANILVNKNITTITSSLITDTRPNNTVCGWITGLIEQMDTTTLFNQYEDAQNTFINEKTVEYNNWETEQQNNFDVWFNEVQDEVKATSLYREYQAVYNTNESGQNVITIPSSINYVHNSLDVLNVFINGMRLLKDVEYTINSDGSSITLSVPLDVANTDVEFVNKKSVEGSVAESVVVQVEKLQADVDSLINCTYLATGADDNITISNIVKNFMNKTGDYSNVTSNANMKIDVVGTINIETLIDEQIGFDFNILSPENRRCIVDFSNATIVSPTSTSSHDLFALFSIDGDVVVKNANILIQGYNAKTIYAFHGGICEDCKINITNIGATTNVYGYWGDGTVKNSKIEIFGGSNRYGVYGASNILFNSIDVVEDSNTAINTTYGIVLGNVCTGTLTTGTQVQASCNLLEN